MAETMSVRQPFVVRETEMKGVSGQGAHAPTRRPVFMRILRVPGYICQPRSRQRVKHYKLSGL